MDQKEIIAKALRALGSTAEEVAARLLELGHRGQRCGCLTCPVAEYLASALPAAEWYVEVSEETVYARRRPFGSPYGAAFGKAIVLPTPLPVSEFIYKFDMEKAYPELATGVSEWVA